MISSNKFVDSWAIDCHVAMSGDQWAVIPDSPYMYLLFLSLQTQGFLITTQPIRNASTYLLAARLSNIYPTDFSSLITVPQVSYSSYLDLFWQTSNSHVATTQSTAGASSSRFMLLSNVLICTVWNDGPEFARQVHESFDRTPYFRFCKLSDAGWLICGGAERVYGTAFDRKTSPWHC